MSNIDLPIITAQFYWGFVFGFVLAILMVILIHMVLE